jgi:tRNA threonylcarbamoyladenosine biosynthesis protein TsaE
MPIYITQNEKETIELAKTLAKSLKAGDVIALYGELGSGKTCFVKGVAEGLEFKGEVTSPTFVLINEYKGKLPIYHFDCYRLDTLKEFEKLGYEEYFYDDGVCLIEWAEKIRSLLPEKRIDVFINYSEKPEERKIEYEIKQ